MIGDDELEEIQAEADRIVTEAVEFADASPEPPLESLYENLYVLGEHTGGWYAVDERTPEPHPGELEHEVGAEGEIAKLAEAGAAYAGRGQPSSSRRPETGEAGPSDDAQEEEGSRRDEDAPGERGPEEGEPDEGD